MKLFSFLLLVFNFRPTSGLLLMRELEQMVPRHQNYTHRQRKPQRQGVITSSKLLDFYLSRRTRSQ